MPYLQLELDAKKNAARVARASDVHPGVILWGLAELWEHVRETKREVVDATALEGCFGPSEKIRAALITFNFLEVVADGFRVKGADRLFRDLNPSERGRMGGKKTAEGGKSRANLKQFASDATTEANRSNAEATPKQPPKQSPKLTEALPPSTQHLTPRDSKAGRPPESDALGQRLCNAFKAARGADYQPAFADEQALRVLLRLANGNEDEIVRRYGLGLRRKRFPLITTWVDLSKRWNDCATPEPESAAFPAKVGRATEAEKDHDAAKPNLLPNGDIAL